jgi:hypothetical protein
MVRFYLSSQADIQSPLGSVVQVVAVIDKEKVTLEPLPVPTPSNDAFELNAVMGSLSPLRDC